MQFPPFLRLALIHDGAAHYGADVERLRSAGVPDTVILQAYKAQLGVQVDAQAEALRMRVATPGAGQALEYLEAQAQAAAALKAPTSATAQKYPLLAVSVGIDVDPETNAPATDILGVARSVQAARDAWLAIGAVIRGARLAGKAAINSATDPAAATAAFEGIDWPVLPG